MLPTPNARDWKGPPGPGFMERRGNKGSLPAVVAAMLPTPRCHDAREYGASPSEQARHTPSLTCQVAGAAGSLHPQFVEWMMGFPPGWTDLDDDDQPTTSTGSTPSGMPSFPKSPK